MTAPVLLVRHGESEWNVARRTQGQTHHPRLTAKGREQAASAARLVAQLLRDRRTTEARVVSSDLVRASETADIVADRLDAPVAEDPRLREMALGSLEGLGYEETWRAGEQHDWSDIDLPIAGGESPAQVGRRMLAVLTEAFVAATAGTAVVLVTHGDAVRYAAQALRGPTAPPTEWLDVPNGAVLLVDPERRAVEPVG
ncbi:histidine phosphatase family protein [Nocardioides solisilvae]|uniref:histidine phosphatase family protein n=1 Tax=Nocardioides solisilvae TaxID=1542435 RepID=UPI000D748891|nr:histidine phosphatase family protein [Nocardioides solisilvae]